MGNVLGINLFNFEFKPGNIDSSCTCLRRTSFPSLQKDWDRLRAERSDMLNKIELAERDHKRRLQIVVDWLSKVDSIETEFDKLKTDHLQQSANKCFSKYCTKTGYILGKKVAKVRKEVLSLLQRKPEVVAENVPIPKPPERPVGPITGQQSILDQVWDCLEGVQYRTIGLYGMGGVGKTTLLTQLNNKLCCSNQRVDVVLWIVVSSNPNLTTIQNDIGKKLGFHNKEWMEKRQDEKADDIFNVLKGKRYVLFLDDVWERVDLEELGVPLPNEINDSRVVLTTRSYRVCGVMEVNKKIQVTCLKEEEAWNLFRMKVGEDTINAHPEIQKIAKLVAKECDGLPLALIVIGRAMASKKTPRAWSNDLYRLRMNYSTEITGTEDTFLPRLKFSYDSLSSDSLKSCFLYCSLYPEDYVIDKEDIIDKWICEGFLDGFNDLHEARNGGYEYIDTLVNASLLEESSPEEIKMHDIIREMAIWIGCECGEVKNKYFVRAGVGLTETPNLAKGEDFERVSLIRNEIKELEGKPNCPNLVTLFLNEGSSLCHIDNEFFQFMGKLRVLDLSRNYYLYEIPEEVWNLVTLEYLNLKGTDDISKLPINLHKLENLKWLTIESKLLPDGVLSKLQKLQVLHINGRGDYRAVPPSTSNFVDEIENLKHLQDLGIGISGDDELSRFSSSQKLATITTRLEVHHMSTSTNLDILVSQKMVNLKDLVIRYCYELENVISNSEIRNYNNYIHNLKTLSIVGCHKLKDITVLFTFAPNLESIHVSECTGMKELCGEWKWEHTTPFPKLKTLILQHLFNLERIYPNALPALFPCLKGLGIIYCPKLKKLPFNSSSCNSGSGVFIRGHTEWWNELEWEDDATRIAFRNAFRNIEFK